MEIWVLDDLKRRIAVVDDFISLIWTERWQSAGDFQVSTYSTPASRSLLVEDTYLGMNKSKYVMRIESVEDRLNDQQQQILTVKGKSYEAILLDRVAKDSTLALGVVPTWDITDTPGAIARKLFHDICVTGILSTSDKLANVVEGSLLAASNIPEPADAITVNLKPDTVYAGITGICVPWDLGFRFLREDSTGLMYFDIYSGSDRTKIQTILPPVVFSPKLDNLQNVGELTVIGGAKNVAYVFSPDGFEMVYPTGVDPDVEDLERRILVVVADDITSSSTSDVPAALIQRGREALAANRVFRGLDGEISQHAQYVYGVDYNLGDLVVEENVDGVASNMRVSEQIFVDDAQGERSYPTLTVSEFINTGSWMSWMADKKWIDLDSDPTTWSEQP